VDGQIPVERRQAGAERLAALGDTLVHSLAADRRHAIL